MINFSARKLRGGVQFKPFGGGGFNFSAQPSEGSPEVTRNQARGPTALGLVELSANEV